jgi:hypothetical protein
MKLPTDGVNCGLQVTGTPRKDSHLHSDQQTKFVTFPSDRKQADGTSNDRFVTDWSLIESLIKSPQVGAPSIQHAKDIPVKNLSGPLHTTDFHP